MDQAIDVRALRTIRRGDDADALTLAAYEQVTTLLEELDPPAWDTVTGYRDWTVRDTVAHLVGSASSHASVLEQKRQSGHTAKQQADLGADEVESRTTLQIADSADLAPAQLVFRLRVLAPRAVAGSQRREDWFGSEPSRRSHSGLPLGSAGLSLAEMCNVSLARDVWMHRFDIAEATGRELRINDEVDGAILAGIVAEWCERHGEPVDLELTGRMPRHFVSGEGGPSLRIDSLDFCRVLAGRPPLGPVPDSSLLEVRVAF